MTESIGKPRRGRGRPRKPTVVRNRDGSCSVRTTLVVEGETVRKQMRVNTTDRAVARARGERLALGEAPELVAQRGESFAEAATRIVEASTIGTKKNRMQRLRDFAFPVFGDLPVSDVSVNDVSEALQLAAKSIGAWSQTVRHLKNDVSAVLGTLFSANVIKENVALRISFRRKDNSLGGQKIRRVTPPRIVLNDEEFEAFVAYGLRDGRQLSELYMLALCARCLGGMRTSDLHAWRWDHIDVVDWQEALVPRPKTRGSDDEFSETELEPYELMPELVPHLSAWWRRHGCPTEGPVFPVRRGNRAGLHKARGTSYARELRAELWAAGIVRPAPGFERATTDAQKKKLCALQSGISQGYRKRARLDFHSFRRAYVTAATSLPELNVTDSMRLSDHRDLPTHLRYKRQDQRIVTPEKLIPRIMAPSLPKTDELNSKIHNDYRRARQDSNLRPTAPEADGTASPHSFSHQIVAAVDPVTRSNTQERRKSAPKIPAAEKSPLAMIRAAAHAALEAGDWALVDQLRPLIEAEQRREQATAPISLKVVRAKREGK